MISLDEFVQKYSGATKGYPTDSQYQGECLSLVKLYIKECFGIDPPPSGSNSAYGYWSNFPHPLETVFEKVAYSPGLVPRRGDIPIWNTNVGGGAGHIDIFLQGATDWFDGFDQNWNGRVAHRQTHTYTNVVGWLTPKGGHMVQVPDDVYSKLVTNSDAYDATCDELSIPRNSSKDTSVSAIKKLKEQAANQPTPPQVEPPVIPGWTNNGLQVRVGDRTYNYEKS